MRKISLTTCHLPLSICSRRSWTIQEATLQVTCETETDTSSEDGMDRGEMSPTDPTVWPPAGLCCAYALPCSTFCPATPARVDACECSPLTELRALLRWRGLSARRLCAWAANIPKPVHAAAYTAPVAGCFVRLPRTSDEELTACPHARSPSKQTSRPTLSGKAATF